jgi:hypothetical protein
MHALADPGNGWVVPGNPAESRLVTQLLSGPSRMARFLAMAIPELDGKSARTIIINWIEKHCPVPKPPQAAAEAVADAPEEKVTPPAKPRAARRTAVAAQQAAADRGPVAIEVPAAALLASPGQRPLDPDEYAREVSRKSIASVRVSREQRRGLRTRYYGPGGGACH